MQLHFVSDHRGGALQAGKLANGAVQVDWRHSLGGKTAASPSFPVVFKSWPCGRIS